MYPNLFRDQICKFKDYKFKFDVDESVVPEQDKWRPSNIRDSIESEI